MLAPLPPPPSALQRFRDRVLSLPRSSTQADPWQALGALSLSDASQKAWRLARAGVKPSALLPLPVPAVWVARSFSPALPEGAPELTLPSLLEDGDLIASSWEDCQHWLPWGWAWKHHADGLTALRMGMIHAIRAGNVPWFHTLAHCWPDTPSAVQVWKELEALIWARPVHPGPEAWASRGDWRHTLGLWRAWSSRTPLDEREYCLISSQGRPFLGASAHRWRWRQHHFKFWQDIGAPAPSMTTALQLAGLSHDGPGGWEGWVLEGFEGPSEDGHVATERCAQQLWDFLGAWVDVEAACLEAPALAWLSSSRGMGKSPPRSEHWRGVEKEWAQRLAVGSQSGWDWDALLHAAASNPGLARVGLEALEVLPWPASSFSSLRDGKLPWERCSDLLQLQGKQWWAADRMELTRIMSWLRSRSRANALGRALQSTGPYGRGPRL